MHVEAVAQQRVFIPERSAFVRRWIDCARTGGTDADGDGVPWCRDCDDKNPAVRPGAGCLL